MSDKISQHYTTLVPAYGRDYKSANEVKADFLSHKDFKLALTSQYCSIRDFTSGTIVSIRYAKNTKVTTITTP